MKPRVDFLISNDRHHVGMFLPVAARLAASHGYRCRVLSMCELRGLPSPEGIFEEAGCELVRVLPSRLGRTRSAMPLGPGEGSRRMLRLGRPLAWTLLLRPRLGRILAHRPDLVVVPNDAAYPYDRISALLRKRRIPFLLVQEGVRYRDVRTDDPGVLGQGLGGADAIAAWGETSAEFFRLQGAPANRIVATGNPRFDVIAAGDWAEAAESLRREHRLGPEILLFLSNPIETHGLCTHEEKLALVRRFVEGVSPLLEDAALDLVIKLHAGESERAFASALDGLPASDRITILGEAPLYPLLALARAAVVLTSSAGLEALLFGASLGVLEIPGLGFVHDYVSGGGALGLDWDQALDLQVERLLGGPDQRREEVEAYLDRTLATRSDAAGRLVDLVRQLAEDGRKTESERSRAR